VHHIDHFLKAFFMSEGVTNVTIAKQKNVMVAQQLLCDNFQGASPL